MFEDRCVIYIDKRSIKTLFLIGQGFLFLLKILVFPNWILG